MTRISSVFRAAAWSLVFTLSLEPLLWAAPEIPAMPLIRFEPGRSLGIPESVARVRETWNAPAASAKSPRLYLIEDAHTNPSGQLNLAKTLEHLFQVEPSLSVVFVEAGQGDNSLTPLRAYGDADYRKQVALGYVRSGELHGEEFWNLVSERPFTIWGVEDLSLYGRSVERYRRVAQKRELLKRYLASAESTLDVVKRRIASPELVSLLDSRVAYFKNQKGLAEYLAVLSHAAVYAGLSLPAGSELKKLQQLRGAETRLDFVKASDQQRQAVASLPEAVQERLRGMLAERVQTASSYRPDDRAQDGFFALLEEALASSGRPLRDYPDFSEYLNYRRAAKALDPEKLIEEFEALEAVVLESLAHTPSERQLVRAAQALVFWSKLFDLSLTPLEFERGSRFLSAGALEEVTGFLNRSLMDSGAHAERALFLEPSFEEALRAAKDFYELTAERDEAMLNNLTGGHEAAVLIAGGFHTPRLQQLLKARGISYVRLTPQVTEPTRQSRYEALLLAQPSVPTVRGGDRPAASESNRVLTTLMRHELAEGESAAVSAYARLEADLSQGARLSTENRGTTYRYWAINKKNGVLSVPTGMRNDSREDLVKALFKLLGSRAHDFHPIGRLDYDVSGLMLFTDDPEALVLMLPQSHIQKHYVAWVNGAVTDKALKRLREGVEIPVDGQLYKTQPAEAYLGSSLRNMVHLILHEGKYHQVKLMMSAVGFPIIILMRRAIGPIDADEITWPANGMLELKGARLEPLLKEKQKAWAHLVNLAKTNPKEFVLAVASLSAFKMDGASDAAFKLFKNGYDANPNQQGLLLKLVMERLSNDFRQPMERLADRIAAMDEAATAYAVAQLLTEKDDPGRLEDYIRSAFNRKPFIKRALLELVLKWAETPAGTDLRQRAEVLSRALGIEIPSAVPAPPVPAADFIRGLESDAHELRGQLKRHHESGLLIGAARFVGAFLGTWARISRQQASRDHRAKALSSRQAESSGARLSIAQPPSIGLTRQFLAQITDFWTTWRHTTQSLEPLRVPIFLGDGQDWVLGVRPLQLLDHDTKLNMEVSLLRGPEARPWLVTHAVLPANDWMRPTTTQGTAFRVEAALRKAVPSGFLNSGLEPELLERRWAQLVRRATGSYFSRRVGADMAGARLASHNDDSYRDASRKKENARFLLALGLGAAALALFMASMPVLGLGSASEAYRALRGVRLGGWNIGDPLSGALIAALIGAVTDRMAVLSSDAPYYAYRPRLRFALFMGIRLLVGASTPLFNSQVIDALYPVDGQWQRTALSIVFVWVKNAIPSVTFTSAWARRSTHERLEKGAIDTVQAQRELSLYSRSSQLLKQIKANLGKLPLTVVENHLLQNVFPREWRVPIEYVALSFVNQLYRYFMDHQRDPGLPLRFFVPANAIPVTVLYGFGLIPETIFLAATVLWTVTASVLALNGLRSASGGSRVSRDTPPQDPGELGRLYEKVRRALEAQQRLIQNRWIRRLYAVSDEMTMGSEPPYEDHLFEGPGGMWLHLHVHSWILPFLPDWGFFVPLKIDREGRLSAGDEFLVEPDGAASLLVSSYGVLNQSVRDWMNRHAGLWLKRHEASVMRALSTRQARQGPWLGFAVRDPRLWRASNDRYFPDRSEKDLLWADSNAPALEGGKRLVFRRAHDLPNPTSARQYRLNPDESAWARQWEAVVGARLALGDQIQQDARTSGQTEGEVMARMLGLPVHLVPAGLRVEGSDHSSALSWEENRRLAMERFRAGAARMIAEGRFPPEWLILYVETESGYEDWSFAAHELLHHVFLAALSDGQQHEFVHLALEAARKQTTGYFSEIRKRFGWMNDPTMDPKTVLKDVSMLVDASELFAMAFGSYQNLVPRGNVMDLSDFLSYFEGLKSPASRPAPANGARLAKSVAAVGDTDLEVHVSVEPPGLGSGHQARIRVYKKLASSKRPRALVYYGLSLDAADANNHEMIQAIADRAAQAISTRQPAVNFDDLYSILQKEFNPESLAPPDSAEGAETAWRDQLNAYPHLSETDRVEAAWLLAHAIDVSPNDLQGQMVPDLIRLLDEKKGIPYFSTAPGSFLEWVFYCLQKTHSLSEVVRLAREDTQAFKSITIPVMDEYLSAVKHYLYLREHFSNGQLDEAVRSRVDAKLLDQFKKAHWGFVSDPGQLEPHRQVYQAVLESARQLANSRDTALRAVSFFKMTGEGYPAWKPGYTNLPFLVPIPAAGVVLSRKALGSGDTISIYRYDGQIVYRVLQTPENVMVSGQIAGQTPGTPENVGIDLAQTVTFKVSDDVQMTIGQNRAGHLMLKPQGIEALYLDAAQIGALKQAIKPTRMKRATKAQMADADPEAVGLILDWLRAKARHAQRADSAFLYLDANQRPLESEHGAEHQILVHYYPQDQKWVVDTERFVGNEPPALARAIKEFNNKGSGESPAGARLADSIIGQPSQDRFEDHLIYALREQELDYAALENFWNSDPELRGKVGAALEGVVKTGMETFSHFHIQKIELPEVEFRMIWQREIAKKKSWGVTRPLIIWSSNGQIQVDLGSERSKIVAGTHPVRLARELAQYVRYKRAAPQTRKAPNVSSRLTRSIPILADEFIRNVTKRRSGSQQDLVMRTWHLARKVSVEEDYGSSGDVSVGWKVVLNVAYHANVYEEIKNSLDDLRVYLEGRMQENFPMYNVNSASKPSNDDGTILTFNIIEDLSQRRRLQGLKGKGKNGARSAEGRDRLANGGRLANTAHGNESGLERPIGLEPAEMQSRLEAWSQRSAESSAIRFALVIKEEARSRGISAGEVLKEWSEKNILEIGPGENLFIQRFLVDQLGFDPERLYVAEPNIITPVPEALERVHIFEGEIQDAPDAWQGKIDRVIGFYSMSHYNPGTFEDHRTVVNRISSRLNALLKPDGLVYIAPLNSRAIQEIQKFLIYERSAIGFAPNVFRKQADQSGYHIPGTWHPVDVMHFLLNRSTNPREMNVTIDSWTSDGPLPNAMSRTSFGQFLTNLHRQKLLKWDPDKSYYVWPDWISEALTQPESAEWMRRELLRVASLRNNRKDAIEWLEQQWRKWQSNPSGVSLKALPENDAWSGGLFSAYWARFAALADRWADRSFEMSEIMSEIDQSFSAGQNYWKPKISREFIFRNSGEGIFVVENRAGAMQPERYRYEEWFKRALQNSDRRKALETYLPRIAVYPGSMRFFAMNQFAKWLESGSAEPQSVKNESRGDIAGARSAEGRDRPAYGGRLSASVSSPQGVQRAEPSPPLAQDARRGARLASWTLLSQSQGWHDMKLYDLCVYLTQKLSLKPSKNFTLRELIAMSENDRWTFIRSPYSKGVKTPILNLKNELRTLLKRGVNKEYLVKIGTAGRSGVSWKLNNPEELTSGAAQYSSVDAFIDHSKTMIRLSGARLSFDAAAEGGLTQDTPLSRALRQTQDRGARLAEARRPVPDVDLEVRVSIQTSDPKSPDLAEVQVYGSAASETDPLARFTFYLSESDSRSAEPQKLKRAESIAARAVEAVKSHSQRGRAGLQRALEEALDPHEVSRQESLREFLEDGVYGARLASGVAGLQVNFLTEAEALLDRIAPDERMVVYAVGPGEPVDPTVYPQRIPWEMEFLKRGAQVHVYEPSDVRHAQWKNLQTISGWESIPAPASINGRFADLAEYDGPKAALLMSVLSATENSVSVEDQGAIRHELAQVLVAGDWLLVGWYSGGTDPELEKSRHEENIQKLQDLFFEKDMRWVLKASGEEPRTPSNLRAHVWEAHQLESLPAGARLAVQRAGENAALPSESKEARPHGHKTQGAGDGVARDVRQESMGAASPAAVEIVESRDEILSALRVHEQRYGRFRLAILDLDMASYRIKMPLGGEWPTDLKPALDGIMRRVLGPSVLIMRMDHGDEYFLAFPETRYAESGTLFRLRSVLQETESKTDWPSADRIRLPLTLSGIVLPSASEKDLRLIVQGYAPITKQAKNIFGRNTVNLVTIPQAQAMAQGARLALDDPSGIHRLLKEYQDKPALAARSIARYEQALSGETLTDTPVSAQERERLRRRLARLDRDYREAFAGYEQMEGPEQRDLRARRIVRPIFGSGHDDLIQSIARLDEENIRQLLWLARLIDKDSARVQEALDDAEWVEAVWTKYMSRSAEYSTAHVSRVWRDPSVSVKEKIAVSYFESFDPVLDKLLSLPAPVRRDLYRSLVRYRHARYRFEQWRVRRKYPNASALYLFRGIKRSVYQGNFVKVDDPSYFSASLRHAKDFVHPGGQLVMARVPIEAIARHEISRDSAAGGAEQFLVRIGSYPWLNRSVSHLHSEGARLASEPSGASDGVVLKGVPLDSLKAQLELIGVIKGFAHATVHHPSKGVVGTVARMDETDPKAPYIARIHSYPLDPNGLYELEWKDGRITVRDHADAEAGSGARLSATHDHLPELLTIASKISGNDADSVLKTHQDLVRHESDAVVASILSLGVSFLRHKERAGNSAFYIAQVRKNYQQLHARVTSTRPVPEVGYDRDERDAENRQIAAWLSLAAARGGLSVGKTFEMYSRYERMQMRVYGDGDGVKVFSPLEAALLTVAESQPGRSRESVLKDFYTVMQELQHWKVDHFVGAVWVFGLSLSNRTADEGGRSLYREISNRTTRLYGVRDFLSHHLFTAALLQDSFPGFDRYLSRLEKLKSEINPGGPSEWDFLRTAYEREIDQAADAADAVRRRFFRERLAPVLTSGRDAYEMIAGALMQEEDDLDVRRRQFGIAKGRRPGIGINADFYQYLEVRLASKDLYQAVEGDLLFYVGDILQFILRPTGLLIDGPARPYKFVEVPSDNPYFADYVRIIRDSLNGKPNLADAGLLNRVEGDMGIGMILEAVKSSLRDRELEDEVMAYIRMRFGAGNQPFTPGMIANGLRRRFSLDQIRVRDIFASLKHWKRGIEEIPGQPDHWRIKAVDHGARLAQMSDEGQVTRDKGVRDSARENPVATNPTDLLVEQKQWPRYAGDETRLFLMQETPVLESPDQSRKQRVQSRFRPDLFPILVETGELNASAGLDLETRMHAKCAECGFAVFYNTKTREALYAHSFGWQISPWRRAFQTASARFANDKSSVVVYLGGHDFNEAIGDVDLHARTGIKFLSQALDGWDSLTDPERVRIRSISNRLLYLMKVRREFENELVRAGYRVVTAYPHWAGVLTDHAFDPKTGELLLTSRRRKIDPVRVDDLVAKARRAAAYRRGTPKDSSPSQGDDPASGARLAAFLGDVGRIFKTPLAHAQGMDMAVSLDPEVTRPTVFRVKLEGARLSAVDRAGLSAPIEMDLSAANRVLPRQDALGNQKITHAVPADTAPLAAGRAVVQNIRAFRQKTAEARRVALPKDIVVDVAGLFGSVEGRAFREQLEIFAGVWGVLHRGSLRDTRVLLDGVQRLSDTQRAHLSEALAGHQNWMMEMSAAGSRDGRLRVRVGHRAERRSASEGELYFDAHAATERHAPDWAALWAAIQLTAHDLRSVVDGATGKVDWDRTDVRHEALRLLDDPALASVYAVMGIDYQAGEYLEHVSGLRVVDRFIFPLSALIDRAAADVKLLRRMIEQAA